MSETLQKAYNESRDAYVKELQLACSAYSPSMTQESLRDLHLVALRAAQAIFSARAKALGTDATTINKRLTSLAEELNKREREFFNLNTAKTVRTVARGKEAYFKALQVITNGTLCVHSIDVDNFHLESLESAEKAYAADRNQSYGIDWDRHTLMNYLQEKVTELRLLNTKNNKMYGFEVAMTYFQDMLRKPTGSIEEFDEQHKIARLKALEMFASKRNRSNRFTNDSLKFKAEQYIMVQYSHLKQINSDRNQVAVQKSIAGYDQIALAPSSLWQYCVYPDDLKKLHQDALCRALQTYRSNRSCSVGFNDAEKDELNLHLLLENRYIALADINAISNEIGKVAAFLEFRYEFMTLANQDGNEWYSMSQSKRRECYEKAIVVGVDTFRAKRHEKKRHVVDCYVDELVAKCKNYAQVDV